jgi:hypothetical protein
MRVSSAPCEAGKKTVMEEIPVNLAALQGTVKSNQTKNSMSKIPDLIFTEISSLGYVEFLSRSSVCDVVKVDVVLVRKLRSCVTFCPRNQ